MRIGPNVVRGQMSRLGTLAGVLLLVVAINVAVYFVTDRNLHSNIYPSDADSILIPVFDSVMVSTILLILLIPAVFLVRRGKWQSWVALALTALALILSVLCALDWAMPNHYLISEAYALLSGLTLALVISMARWLASNSALEREPGQPLR